MLSRADSLLGTRCPLPLLRRDRGSVRVNSPGGRCLPNHPQPPPSRYICPTSDANATLRQRLGRHPAPSPALVSTATGGSPPPRLDPWTAPQNRAPRDQFSYTLCWPSLHPPRLPAAAVLGGHMSEQPPDARGSPSPTVSSCRWPSGPRKALTKHICSYLESPSGSLP